MFTENYQFYAPEEIDHEYTLGDGKVMINVGSVGQPRDGDNRSCYVILDDGTTSTSTSAESSAFLTTPADLNDTVSVEKLVPGVPRSGTAVRATGPNRGRPPPPPAPARASVAPVPTRSQGLPHDEQ